MNLATVLERKDAHGIIEQLVFADLEQFVARIGLENIEQRLAAVTEAWEAGTDQNCLDLAPQERDVTRAAVVGGRGVEPEKAVLADDLARRIEAFDADVVHVDRAVYRCAHIGLGQNEQVGLPKVCALRRRQGDERLRWRGRISRRRSAQGRSRHHAQNILAVLLCQFVLAVTQEGEMVVVDPLEKSL